MKRETHFRGLEGTLIGLREVPPCDDNVGTMGSEPYREALKEWKDVAEFVRCRSLRSCRVMVSKAGLSTTEYKCYLSQKQMFVGKTALLPRHRKPERGGLRISVR
jgi:hypothetical protein